MTPFRICRTHSIQPTWNDAECVTPECDIVSMVWSADGAALFVVKECENCQPPKGDGKGTVCLGYHPETDDGPGEYEWGPCPSCGGSGWRYAADIEEAVVEDFAGDEYAGLWVAVVPLKDNP